MNDCCSHDHVREQAPDPCGHMEQEAGRCHSSPLLPCPGHFGQLNGEAMCAADGPPTAAGERPFLEALMHLNNDGYTIAAWYTWMALIGEYSVPPGADKLRALSRPNPPCPPEAPEYFRLAYPLVAYACRSAVLGDFEAVEATLGTAHRKLDIQGMVSFLKSCAASAQIAVDHNDACTVDHLMAYSLLGSQAANGYGAAVLPCVVDMVVAQKQQRHKDVFPALDRLMKIPGDLALIAATDLLGRALAQTVKVDATMLYGEGPLTSDGSSIKGVADIDGAEPENTDRAVMMGVWAMRASRAYAEGTCEGDAADRINAVSQRHGNTGRFALDVVLAGTQILGYSLRTPVHDSPAV